MVYTLRFIPLQNAVCFLILTYLVPVLFTFYIQGVLKFKKIIQAAKELTEQLYNMSGVFFEGIGGLGVRGATRSLCFNSGYRDLGLLYE